MNWVWPTPVAAVIANEACLGHYDHALDTFGSALVRVHAQCPGDEQDKAEAVTEEGGYLLRVLFQRYVHDVQAINPDAFTRPDQLRFKGFVDHDGNQVLTEDASPEHQQALALFQAFVNEHEDEWERLMCRRWSRAESPQEMVKFVCRMVHAQYNLTRLELEWASVTTDHDSIPDTVPREWFE